MSWSGDNLSEPCLANIFSQRDFFPVHDWWDDVGMHCKFSPLARPSPCQDSRSDALAGRAADGGCSQFGPDYSFRRKRGSSDGELEHPVLL